MLVAVSLELVCGTSSRSNMSWELRKYSGSTKTLPPKASARFQNPFLSTATAQDATGEAYSALGFSNGFEPRLPGDKKINPYLRLLPMLAGIG